MRHSSALLDEEGNVSIWIDAPTATVLPARDSGKAVQVARGMITLVHPEHVVRLCVRCELFGGDTSLGGLASILHHLIPFGFGGRASKPFLGDGWRPGGR